MDYCPGPVDVGTVATGVPTYSFHGRTHMRVPTVRCDRLSQYTHTASKLRPPLGDSLFNQIIARSPVAARDSHRRLRKLLEQRKEYCESSIGDFGWIFMEDVPQRAQIISMKPRAWMPQALMKRWWSLICVPAVRTELCQRPKTKPGIRRQTLCC